MDFVTTHAPPVAITIDGKAYQVPRFLIPALKEWAASITKTEMDAAAAEFTTPDERARFRRFWPAPIFDVVALYQRALTPDGSAYVVDTQLKAAGVPDEVRAAMLANADPFLVRSLSEKLLQVDQTLDKLGVDTEVEGKDPLPPPPGASGG